MRHSVPDQLALVPAFHTHVRSRELEAMSQILDVHPAAAKWVLADLVGRRVSARKGRDGMSGEQVLRVMLVKQLCSFSYDELAFHLADSTSYRAFCRIGIHEKIPTAKTLQRNVKMVAPQTLAKINRLLVEHARANEIEDGIKIRVDCTVTETNIHAPTDSSLLRDSVRVLVRLIDRAREYVDVAFTDHQRRAKRRAIAIQHARSTEERLPLYQDLIKVTERTVSAAERAIAAFSSTYPPQVLEDPVIFDLLHIIKDRRDTLYGHKICLAAGASGLVTDCNVEKGNPADSTLAINMIERHMKVYGRPPRQACFDGGFASRDNLDQIKLLGVKDVVFTKSKGIDVREMARSEESFRELRRFRAGIEATISFLKRCFGWTRCAWRSLRSFQAYTWASVVAANLLLLARAQIA
jgi:IS5 family transposase